MIAGSGTVAGVGFTVSLLIADIAFDGRELDEAKVGVLAAAILASVASCVRVPAPRRLPAERRARQLLGTAEDLVDLSEDVDPERDHIRGPDSAPVTLVEYGDYQCPYCGQAELVIRELLDEFGDELRYVWRHLPLNDVHAERADGGRGDRGRGRPGRVLADARPAARRARTSWARGPRQRGG